MGVTANSIPWSVEIQHSFTAMIPLSIHFCMGSRDCLKMYPFSLSHLNSLLRPISMPFSYNIFAISPTMMFSSEPLTCLPSYAMGRCSSIRRSFSSIVRFMMPNAFANNVFSSSSLATGI